MRKQVLGILFSDRDWNGIWNRTSSESADLYVDLAANHDLEVCFFRIRDIDFRTQTVLAVTRIDDEKWRRERMPLPRVVHNRAVHRLNTTENSLRTLRNCGVTVYNYWNNFSKLDVHNKIRKKRALRRYLPATCRFTRQNLERYLRFGSLFLKPDRGAVGKGIIKIDRCSANLWIVTRQQKDLTMTDKVATGRLYSFLRRHTGGRWYILQRTIDLLTYHGSPFDIRVSVQRDSTGRWQVTGMVGKVARERSHLSNVYQGGRVVRLTELFRDQIITCHDARKMLSQAALEIARHLAAVLPHLADVGFDFGISRDGKPYFIEMNCRDQRYSFRLADMVATFRRTYQNPVAYGKNLLARDASRGPRHAM